MNKTAFAEHILFSASLDQKLISIDQFNVTNQKQTKTIPKIPARDKMISFHKNTDYKFPSTEQLDDEKYRGILFHFFANHELLALELMALMILKFPNAPESYTNGLIHIMKEEQSHLKLYLTRMHEYGVELGDVGLNDYFWRMISPLSSLYEFIAAMSLTFEQANIDFAGFYINEMKKVEDEKSILTLQTVYDDEIGHVKHGLDYFNQWKTKGQSDWKAYVKALHFPLTPRRAKGSFYDISARRKIGFSEEFIENLNVYSHSRGKPPDLYYFNPLVEYDIAKTKIPKKYKHLEDDLESLLIFAGSEDDIVLSRKKIEKKYLLELSEINIKLPQILPLKNLSSLKSRKCNSFIPWAMFGNENLDLTDIDFSRVYDDIDSALFSKEYSQELSKKISDQCSDDHQIFRTNNFSAQCKSVEDIKLFIQNSSANEFVLKANYGNAGNRFHFFKKEAFNSDNFDKSIFNYHQSYICQPYLKRFFDFSIQFEKSKSRINKKGFVRNIIDSKGRFKGSIIGQFKAVFPKEIQQFLMYHIAQSARIENVINAIKDVLLVDSKMPDKLNFGIDMFCFHQNNTVNLHPCIEINPRMTMGRVSLFIQKDLHHKSVALWRILSLNEVKKMGYESLIDFHQSMKERFTIELSDSKIAKGYFASSDPYSATHFISFACVELNLEMLKMNYQALLSDIHFE